MQKYEYEEVEQASTDEKQTRTGMLLMGIFCLVYVLLIAAYAWQTWQLVNWLFPDDNWAMKIMGVFVCDGCAILYAAGETFYKFKLRKTYYLVGIMWGLTFIMSTVASAINLYLSSTKRIPHTINPDVLSAAYIIDIIAFIANIVAFTFIFKFEHSAGKPKRVYMDDGARKRKPDKQPQQTAVSTPVQQQLSASSTPSHDAIEAEQYQAFLAWQKTEHAPFPEALLNHQQADQVSQNGHKQ